MKDVLIIGAGISGLSTAFFLKKMGKDILLCEKRDRVGGVIHSIRREGYLLEEGPTTLRGISKNAEELFREVHLIPNIIYTNKYAQKRYIYKNKKLHTIPRHPVQFFSSRLLSMRAKGRLLQEPFISKGEVDEESAWQFFVRRLGKEVTETCVDPFVSGIYAGDLHQLSAQATFPTLVKWERNFGSIFRGWVFQKREKKDKRLFSFREGMGELPKALESWLGDAVWKEAQIIRIEKNQRNHFWVYILRGGHIGSMETKSIVFATPAYVTAEFTRNINTSVSECLSTISYAPLMIYHLGYQKNQISHSLDGFGYLVPRSEQMKTLGVLWNSSLFENRVPQGHILLTVMVGGASHPKVLEEDSHTLFHEVLSEISLPLGIKGSPHFFSEKRHLKAIPQYEKGHLKKVEDLLEFSRHSGGIFFSGNYLQGLSTLQCIEEGKKTAEKIGACSSS